LPVDTANNVVCGRSSSLSPFVLAGRAFAFAGLLQPGRGPWAERGEGRAPQCLFKFSLGANYGLSDLRLRFPVLSAFDCARWYTPGTTIEALADRRKQRFTTTPRRAIHLRMKTERLGQGTCRQVVSASRTERTRSALLRLPLEAPRFAAAESRAAGFVLLPQPRKSRRSEFEDGAACRINEIPLGSPAAHRGEARGPAGLGENRGELRVPDHGGPRRSRIAIGSCALTPDTTLPLTRRRLQVHAAPVVPLRAPRTATPGA
jgi:hypothetical protein